MKSAKRILAMALVMIMALGLATTAFAAEGSTYTITITDAVDGATVTGHTYNVYQIYKGDLATEEDNEDNVKTILSNVVYGKNYGTEGEEVPETELDALAAMTGEAAAAFLKEGIENKNDSENKNDPIAVLNDDNGFTTNQVAGYYLIEDVTENLPQNQTPSAFILQVVGDVTVNSKHTSGPVVEKKVDDKNDSTTAEDTVVWQDSADHDIGDEIDFQISATIPSAFTLFKNNNKAYPFTFHDTEENGLTFQEIKRVYILGENGATKAISDSNYTLVSSPTDGCTFEIMFNDLTKIEGVAADTKIVVEYTSVLNETAIHGKEGNVNTVYGQYTNYYNTEGPNYTPSDTVIVFTYKVVVNKVDENNKPLDGATFTLEKFVASSTGTETYKEVTGAWVAQDVVEAVSGTAFTFNGLDDGEYRLTETETPAGYNTVDPIYFTVTADHDVKWGASERIEVLNGLSGNAGNEITGITFTTSEDNGSLSADVVNKAGTILPETGGIGTTIFYIAGGVMVAVAIVLLVTKKRMSSSK